MASDRQIVGLRCHIFAGLGVVHVEHQVDAAAAGDMTQNRLFEIPDFRHQLEVTLVAKVHFVPVAVGIEAVDVESRQAECAAIDGDHRRKNANIVFAQWRASGVSETAKRSAAFGDVRRAPLPGMLAGLQPNRLLICIRFGKIGHGDQHQVAALHRFANHFDAGRAGIA